MAEKIDIVEILKDKPVGLKFYSNTFGYISFNGVHKDKVYFFSEDTNAHSVKPNGKMYDGGECIIFPSKEMRDWRKFAWKKGDVLVCTDGKAEVIFERFDDDNYTSFVGKHYLESYGKDGELLDYEEIHFGSTVNYTKESEDTAQTYINTIEERLGGKLNMETLEIEKVQPKFKDWDFITIKLSRGGSLIGVFKAENDKNYYLHANLDSRGIITIREDSYCKKSTCIARLSTEEEKLHFFDALAKKGTTWDAVKKQIVDLKQKWIPKPFDRVITRNDADDVWTANIFSHMDSHGEYVTIACVGGYTYCLPYNEETAKLIGTTKDVEG